MRNCAAYDVALELAKEMKPIIEELRRRSAEAGKQVERAMISVLFNIAEGNKRAGKDPVRFFVMARGSVSELQAALDLASVWQWPVNDQRARALLDRERGLLYGLINGKRPAQRSLTNRRPVPRNRIADVSAGRLRDVAISTVSRFVEKAL